MSTLELTVALQGKEIGLLTETRRGARFAYRDSLVETMQGLPELSPLYDVVPVVDVESRARHLSLRIDGVIEFEQVDRQHIMNEALSWGMTPDVVRSVVDDTLERLEEGLLRANQLYPTAGQRHAPGALRRLQ